MSTIIVAVLIAAALVLLVSSLVSGRRDRDPASSVHSFQRAMTAMGSETRPEASREEPRQDHTRRGEMAGPR